LSILQLPGASINAISQDTKIHKQDIYMILPKLEQMGLITKTLERPVYIRAVPPDKALTYVISTEETKTLKKIKHLKETVSCLSEELKLLEQSRQRITESLDVQVVYFSADTAINHRLDEAYASAKKYCNLVINFDLLRLRAALLENRFHILAANKVKTRIIIDNLKMVEDAKKILEQVIPHSSDFSIKQSGKVAIKPYILIDDREVLIATQKLSPGGYPCCLWTNSRNVITIYRDNFEKAWENSHPIISSATQTKPAKAKMRLPPVIN
jgi:sugar-specific transcriptional regulator TrmB